MPLLGRPRARPQEIFLRQLHSLWLIAVSGRVPLSLLYYRTTVHEQRVEIGLDGYTVGVFSVAKEFQSIEWRSEPTRHE